MGRSIVDGCILDKSLAVESNQAQRTTCTMVKQIVTLRLLLEVVATEELKLEQLDVNTTFLHGDFEDNIYMSELAGFSATGEKSHLVCRLK